MKSFQAASLAVGASATSFGSFGSSFGSFGSGATSFGTGATTFGSSSFGTNSWSTPSTAMSWSSPATTTSWSSPSTSWSTPSVTSSWSPSLSYGSTTSSWSPSTSTSSWDTTSSWTSSSPAYTSDGKDAEGYHNGYPIDYSPKVDSGLTPSTPCSQYTVRKYNLDIDDKDIRTLNADISAEKYVPCKITTDFGSANALTYSGAGCRYKGAVGSLLACLDENSGRPNGKCRKLSLKVDANEFRDDGQKIDGLKRMNFHGMAVDKSLVGERLSYNLMRAAGVAASCVAHTEVYINGKFDGVYQFVQEVNGPFTEEWFANDINQGKGAIYKDFWFRPEQTTDAWLKDHHKAGPEEHEFIREVYRAVQAAPENGGCDVLNRYFDTDRIATITALNDYIGQTDDWRMRHNFFWYVRDDGFSKKLVMIPWDYDRLDESSGQGGDFRRKKAGTWHQPSTTYNSPQCTNPQPDPSVQGAAYATGTRKKILDRKVKALPVDASSDINCDKITRMLGSCLYNDYKTKFDNFKTTFPASAMHQKIDAYASQIKDAVSKDSSITSYEWQNGLTSLKNYIRNAPSKAPQKGNTASGFGQMGQMGGGLASFGLGNTGLGGAFGQMSSFGGLGSFGMGLGGFGR